MSSCKARFVVILMAVFLLLSAFPGCAGEEPREILFGCALSLSGELQETGQLCKEGYELWKEHVNSQGGISIGNERYLIEIRYYDDESDPQMTASLVETLIAEDRVDFLLGPYGSSCTFAAAAVANEYGFPMVEGGGAAEEIFTSGFEYTFGLLSPAADYFQNILEGAASLDPKPNKVAIISVDEPVMLSMAEGAEQHAERLGFEVISLTTFENEGELSSILSTLKEHEPNMVLLSSYFGDGLSFVRTAKEVGLSPEMFGMTVAPADPAFVEELGQDANYVFGTSQWVSALPYDGPVFGSSQDYAQLFRNKSGEEPDYHAAAASACGVTYQLALEQASSLDRERVRDALASLDVVTFYGRIRFNEQGRDTYNPMVAVQIQGGNVVTVWPQHLATGYAIYPTPPWGERELVFSSPDQIISVNVGQEFNIALYENPTTGYIWQADFDDSFLELVEDKYEPSVKQGEGDEPIVGAGGTRSWRFGALVSGETEVTMASMPPGQDAPADMKVFTVSIS